MKLKHCGKTRGTDEYFLNIILFFKMFVKKDDESDSVSKSVTLNMLSNVQTAKKSAVAFKTFRDTVLIFIIRIHGSGNFASRFETFAHCIKRFQKLSCQMS